MGALAIKPNHYAQLKEKVFVLLDEQSRDMAQHGLDSLRIRWDIYWASNGAFTNTSEYHYLNDNHIDSALRAILKEYVVKQEVELKKDLDEVERTIHSEDGTVNVGRTF